MCLEIKDDCFNDSDKRIWGLSIDYTGNYLLSQNYSKFDFSWTFYKHKNWYEMGHEQEQWEHCSYHHDI